MRRGAALAMVGAAVSLPVLLHMGGGLQAADAPPARSPARPPTRVGINLFGAQWHNRQQVFANMIAQSEWMESRGAGWKAFPPGQLDAMGWVQRLEPGQVAPRLLALPSAPYRKVAVRCTFRGGGELGAGGIAQVSGRGRQDVRLTLNPTGAEGEMGWIELRRTDPRDPLRDIDCRTDGTPVAARFDPEFVQSLSGFAVLRFMDWQRTNDNARIAWDRRTLPQSSSQVAAAGVAVEDMVDLANAVHADPWFTMPYHADGAYLHGFARLVHDRLDPDLKVHVELGNEVWNTMFAAARDAGQEGLARSLGDGDPHRARMERYAQRMTDAMRVWTQVYADRPGALVRVCATQNANPDLARTVLGFRDTARWVDALATAPYVGTDLAGYGPGDVDRVFAAMPGALAETFEKAAENRAVAATYGKRYIAYEGGQHLVTPDLALARAVQRDPRMGAIYDRYLTQWRSRFGDTMVLYASTAPISQWGAWGLSEHGGQPLAQAPKLRAVRNFLETTR
ncbi:hypothetical protein [Novosphingobium gossypii]|uniref:hypothetical protein n=1 Tax=Novosphingobium gossypii TaxID=1604774 RepID=UPI003D1E1135